MKQITRKGVREIRKEIGRKGKRETKREREAKAQERGNKTKKARQSDMHLTRDNQQCKRVHSSIAREHASYLSVSRSHAHLF